MYIFFLLMLFSCRPNAQTVRGSSDSSSRYMSSRNAQSSLTNHSDAGTPSATAEKIHQDILSELPSESIAQLKKMSLPELTVYFSEQQKQNQANVEDLQISDAINKGLCGKVNSIRTNCPAIKRIIPSGLATLLQCDGSYKKDDTDDTIEVLISSMDHTAEPPQDKQFVLEANDVYQSSVFPFGTKTKVQFQAIGGSDMLAPKFLSLYKLSVVGSTKDMELPDKKNIQIEVFVGGHSLIKSMAYASDDPKKESTEYKLDVSPIISMRESSKCKVSEESINAFKKSVIDSIKSNQETKNTEDYLKSQEEKSKNQVQTQMQGLEKDSLILKIYQIRTEISKRQPILQGSKDRLFNLTKELIENDTYGCHYNDKIKNIQVVLQGSKNNLEAMGDFKTFQTEPVGGSSTAIEIRLGSGLSFIVDPFDEILKGSAYDIPNIDPAKNALSLGSIEYVQVRKMGVSYDQQMTKSQKFFVIEDVTWQVSEQNTFSISSIQIIVNGLTIYNGDGLDWNFNRNKLEWKDPNLRNNSNWVKLMVDNNCEKVN